MKESIQTRLDSPDLEEISDFMDTWEMTQSATIRRLIRSGIRAEKQKMRSQAPVQVGAESFEVVEDDEADGFDALFVQTDSLKRVQFTGPVQTAGGQDD